MTDTQTTVRADVDSGFYTRFKLICVVAFGFALWSLYDGAVTYPAQRVRALAYLDLPEDGRSQAWEEIATERGWPTQPPGEPKTDGKIYIQYFMAVIAGTASLTLLIVVLRARGRWVESNGSAMTSSWGQSFEFDQVVSLDKRLWRDKGIAKIKYSKGRRKKRFVLDNYKFNRQALDTIIYDLESQIGADKIVGGPPELSREEEVPSRDEEDAREEELACEEGDADTPAE